MRLKMHVVFIFGTITFYLTGAMSPLSEELLTKQDLLLLDVVKFLCTAVAAAPVQTVCFRASEIRRKLLMLIEENTFDFMKPLHLHMVSMINEKNILFVCIHTLLH